MRQKTIEFIPTLVMALSSAFFTCSLAGMVWGLGGVLGFAWPYLFFLFPYVFFGVIAVTTSGYVITAYWANWLEREWIWAQINRLASLTNPEAEEALRELEDIRPPGLQSFVRRIPYKSPGAKAGTLELEEANPYESDWRRAYAETLRWMAAKGKPTAPALVGDGLAFARAEHWVEVTDWMVRNGWLIKPGTGKETRLMGGLTYTGIVRGLESGRPIVYPRAEPPPIGPFRAEPPMRTIVMALENVNEAQ